MEANMENDYHFEANRNNPSFLSYVWPMIMYEETLWNTMDGNEEWALGPPSSAFILNEGEIT
jgi:hypothetical protein